MNKINLVINMQINSLQFLNFTSSQKLIVLFCYERIKIDKAEALINSQCTLASTLRND